MAAVSHHEFFQKYSSSIWLLLGHGCQVSSFIANWMRILYSQTKINCVCYFKSLL